MNNYPAVRGQKSEIRISSFWLLTSGFWLLLFIFGCSKEPLPPYAFITSPASQKINNLVDLNGDKKSELFFWNTSSIPKQNEFLKPYFLEAISILDKKYSKFDIGEVGDIPFIGYFDHDSIIDYGVYRYSSDISDWFIRNGAENSGVTIKLGEKGDLPVPTDYNGDGKFDVVIYRPKDSSFRGILSNSGAPFSLQLGSKGDIPIPKDYDSDGISDFATYKPTDGTWTIRASMTNNISTEMLGGIHFLPLPADYDGDGKADLCVWNYIDNTVKATLTTLRRPLSNDVIEKIQKELKDKDFFPVSGDYDGDGSSELAFWSSSLKTLLSFDIKQDLKKRIYKLTQVRNSEPVISFLLKRFILRNKLVKGSVVNTGRETNLVLFKNGEIKAFGIISMASPKIKFPKWKKKEDVIPFVSDFDGDYIPDSCLWSSATGTFLCNSSRLELQFALEIGQRTDFPLIGNFNSDNITDIGVYRPKEHSFYIRYLGKSVPEGIQVIALSSDVGINAFPQISDYDGDDIDDFAIYIPNKNKYIVKQSSDSKEVKFDFCINDTCNVLLNPVAGDFDGDGTIDPGVIDLRTKIFSYYPSKGEDKKTLLNIKLNQNISGFPFSADIDQDLKSDLVFFNPAKYIWGILLSSKNGEYKEIKFGNSKVKLVNCPWFYSQEYKSWGIANEVDNGNNKT